MACLFYAAIRPTLPDWWRGHGGGIPYVMFWITAWFTLFPFKKHLLLFSAGCVFATVGLEFLQLWHPAWLAGFRATKVGAAWLGSSFSWLDIPPYFIGGGLAYILLWLAIKHYANTSSTDANH